GAIAVPEDIAESVDPPDFIAMTVVIPAFTDHDLCEASCHLGECFGREVKVIDLPGCAHSPDFILLAEGASAHGHLRDGPRYLAEPRGPGIVAVDLVRRADAENRASTGSR